MTPDDLRETAARLITLANELEKPAQVFKLEVVR